MARPQATDYEARREAIIGQAAALFARDGFDRASISELALACGTSKSLIYHYYPSKEAILHAVMANHLAELAAAAGAAAADPAPPADRLRRLIGAFLRLYAGAADRHKVLLNELDRLAPPARAEVIAEQKRLIAVMGDIVAGVAPALRAAPARRHAAAMLVFGMINWTHTWYNPDGSVGAEELAAMVTGMALAGLGGAAAEPQAS